MLVHVGAKRRAGAMRRAEARLAELESLAETAGVEVIDKVIQLRDRIDPKFVLGKGKLDDVVMRAIEHDIETLIFDCDLTPAQASGYRGDDGPESHRPHAAHPRHLRAARRDP